jgi:hypothetical protein
MKNSTNQEQQAESALEIVTLTNSNRFESVK